MDLPAPQLLVVDDDRGLLRLMERTLRREGFEIEAVASAAEAVQALATHGPDLLVIDLKLTDASGEMLIEQLQAARPGVPFMVVTGQGDERVAVEMMKRGALDYLVKDAQFLEVLPAVVGRAVKSVRQANRLAQTEQQVRLVEVAVQQAQDAVIVVSAGPASGEPRVIFANRAFQRLLEIPQETVPSGGLAALSILMPEVDSVVRALKLEHATFGETEVRLPSGAARIIEWQVTPVRDAAGCPNHRVGILRDLTERRRLESELLAVSDREQRRIGQDLHDGLGQHLAGIELMSQVLEQKLAGGSRQAAANAGQIAKHVREAIDQTRALARGLSPVALEAHGLMAALQELAASTRSLFRLDCVFECPQTVLMRNNATATQLYRIAQEAVNNAVKHGKPSRIQIRLEESPGRITLRIINNGAGFSTQPRSGSGMGLRIMRYRAGVLRGTLEIHALEPRGVAVECRCPPPEEPMLSPQPGFAPTRTAQES